MITNGSYVCNCTEKFQGQNCLEGKNIIKIKFWWSKIICGCGIKVSIKYSMILQLSMSALRLHATTMGIVLILKQVILVFVNLALMAKDASQVSWIFKKNYDHCIYKTEPIVWYYTESALYKLQSLANLIHVTTMVHVSLTECLHFAHVWRDSLGKIVHKVNLNYLFSILHLVVVFGLY